MKFFEDIWNYFYDTFFNTGEGYANLGTKATLLITVGAVVFVLYIGIVIACIAMFYNRQIVGSTIRRMLGMENHTEEEATTDSEVRRFLAALKAIKKGYIWALIITACIMVGSIICAVHYRASVGILLLAFAVAVYLAIIINLLYSKLGIAYQAFHGGMTVTALYGKGREVIYIPDRVMLLTVTEIGTRAFSHESSKSIREIHLPKTLLRIGTSAFADLPALTDVYYEGSEEEWAEISRLAPLENVTLHFGEPIPRLEKRKRKKKNAKNIESEKHEESNDNE